MNKLAIIVIIPVLVTGVVTTVGAVNMGIIKQIESGGNSRAVGNAGEVGLFQILSVVRKSYNQRTHHSYSRKDLFNPKINRKIASWYLNIRIPEMLCYYKIPVNIKTTIWAYNAGIGNLVNGMMPKITKEYLEAYRKLVEK